MDIIIIMFYMHILLLIYAIIIYFLSYLFISSGSQTIYSLFNHGESKNPLKESPQKGFIILCIISKFPHTGENP